MREAKPVAKQPRRSHALAIERGTVLLLGVVAVAAILLMLVVFGVNVPGPTYDLLPDPAGAMPY
jgi:hypothetical protein